MVAFLLVIGRLVCNRSLTCFLDNVSCCSTCDSLRLSAALRGVSVKSGTQLSLGTLPYECSILMLWNTTDEEAVSAVESDGD